MGTQIKPQSNYVLSDGSQFARLITGPQYGTKILCEFYSMKTGMFFDGDFLEVAWIQEKCDKLFCVEDLPKEKGRPKKNMIHMPPSIYDHMAIIEFHNLSIGAQIAVKNFYLDISSSDPIPETDSLNKDVLSKLPAAKLNPKPEMEYLNMSDEDITIMQLKKKLPIYGQVEILEFRNNKLHVRIGNGFSTQAVNTFELIKVIIDAAPDHEVIDKLVTDENLFHIILKEPSKKNTNESK